MIQWFHSQVYTKRNENRCSNKILYVNVHSSIIHNGQKVQTTQVFINGLIDKQNVVYLYNGILFSHKEEWSTDIFYNMDEVWKHYTKWKTADTKGHNMSYFLYLKKYNDHNTLYRHQNKVPIIAMNSLLSLTKVN